MRPLLFKRPLLLKRPFFLRIPLLRILLLHLDLDGLGPGGRRDSLLAFDRGDRRGRGLPVGPDPAAVEGDVGVPRTVEHHRAPLQLILDVVRSKSSRHRQALAHALRGDEIEGNLEAAAKVPDLVRASRREEHGVIRPLIESPGLDAGVPRERREICFGEKDADVVNRVARGLLPAVLRRPLGRDVAERAFAHLRPEPSLQLLEILPAEDVPPRALNGLVSLGAPRLHVKQDVDRVRHVPVEPRHRVPRALLLLATVRDVRLGAEIGRDPLLGQLARQVERAVHRVGVRLKREHAHKIGVMRRELLLEVLLRGPILDLEHLPLRLFEPQEELLDADALALAGFANEHVHAPIRHGRAHPRGGPQPRQFALHPADHHRVPAAPVPLKVRQRRRRDVGAGSTRVDVRTPRRPHGTRIVGLGRRANRGVVQTSVASVGRGAPRRRGRSLGASGPVGRGGASRAGLGVLLRLDLTSEVAVLVDERGEVGERVRHGASGVQRAFRGDAEAANLEAHPVGSSLGERGVVLRPGRAVRTRGGNLGGSSLGASAPDLGAALEAKVVLAPVAVPEAVGDAVRASVAHQPVRPARHQLRALVHRLALPPEGEGSSLDADLLGDVADAAAHSFQRVPRHRLRGLCVDARAQRRRE
mmetsp:Transcript_7216/g.32986  ORF Transcript_7216/g.32986 Transcript_7216/m.32986 type:complete len:644 (+) Transcript_7216:2913-4844(+)